MGSGHDYIAVEGAKSARNLFRRLIDIPPAHLLNERRTPVVARRYRSVPCVPADVFHSSYYRIPRRSLPSVVTVHDFMYERFSAYPQRLLHAWQKKRAVRLSGAVICVSESTRTDLLEFYPWIDPATLHVIYNGVDDEFHMQADRPEEIRLNGRVFSTGSFALYVGSRGYCKNFPLALEIIADPYATHLDLTLVCVGGGPFNDREKRRIKTLDIQSRVLAVGNVSNSRLNTLYNHALCLIFPSLYEGFGISALEAMRAGCIVLPARTSSIPEVVGPSPFFYAADSPKGAIQALEALSDHPLTEKTRQDALRRSQAFSWRRCTEETLKVYEKVAGV